MDIRLKETPFEWNGKTYMLRCNMNVLADVQEAFGGELSEAMAGKNSVRTLTEFLAAMLNDYADDMGWPERFTARQVGRQMKPSAIGQIRQAVMALVADALKVEESAEDSKN